MHANREPGMEEPDTLNDLFQAARAALDRAYAPYSRFPVGAAIRDAEGRIHA